MSGGGTSKAAMDENPGKPPGEPAFTGVIGVGGPLELAIVHAEAALECGGGAWT